MLNIEDEVRNFKNEAYGAFAEVTKALSSPRRLELLDLLVQGPFTVEALATRVSQPMASASQHLQVLKRSRLVVSERHGTSMEYRLAPGVAHVFVSLRRLAERHNPALAVATDRFYTRASAPDSIDADTLRRRMAAHDVVLLDVRPAEEYARAHVAGAVSIPIDELEDRVDELPEQGLVVATCRGPFCVFAAEAVLILRRSGREAVRFEQGVADWSLDGGTLQSGASP